MWYAASPMPLELLRKGIATLGEVFAQGYGQSESGPDIAILTKEAHRVLDKPPDNAEGTCLVRPTMHGCACGDSRRQTTKT